MAVLKLTRTRVALIVVCAVLPTLFLLPLEQFKLSPHSFSLTTFDPPIKPNEAVLEAPIPPPIPPTLPITNNNATYPRIILGGNHSEYATEAQQQLARLEDIKGKLSEGQGLNAGQLDRLLAYLRKAETDSEYIPPRVVLTSWHWVPCVYGPCTTGEVQWARPLIEIMKQHDMFYLFSPWENFHKDFKLLGNDLVTHVWADDEQVVWCYDDKERCIQNKLNPDGVPPWKLFAFTFWGSKPLDSKWNSPSTPWSFNPLGSEWNLVPYHMPEKQFFLGYYYQNCQGLEYIPFDEREKRILVLAKLSNYFHNFPAFKPDTFYDQLQNRTDYELVSTADKEEGFPIPDALHSLGLLPQADYDHLLANAKALLGIGKPIISPTPYASLCRGVPVILPYDSQVVLRHNNKTCESRPDSSEWCGFIEEAHQHGPASAIGPPYVYAVDVKSPVEEILEVIDTAISTPIQPYVPPEMRPEVVEARLLDYFAIDWQLYAEERMRELGWETPSLVLPEFLQRWITTHPDPALKNR